MVTDGALSYDAHQRMIASFPEQSSRFAVMKPYGWRRQAWDLCCAVFLVYSGIVTPFTIAFMRRQCGGKAAIRALTGAVSDSICDYFWWERTVDLVFLIDICINFNTAFLDKDYNWCLDRRRIAMKYISRPTGFLIDFLAIVPFEMFNISGNMASSVRLLRLLKLVRLLRLLRMLKLLRLINRYATGIKMSYRTRAIVKFLFLLIMIAHWTACLFRIVSNRVYDPDDGVDVEDLAAVDDGGRRRLVAYAALDRRRRRRRLVATSSGSRPTWLREDGLHAQDVWAQYVAAVCWSLQAMQGGGDAYTGAEYTVQCAIMIFGCIILTLMIGEIANVSTSLDPAGNEYMRTMDMFNSYMDARGFKADLKAELRDYFIHSEGLFREQHYKGLLENLSPQLQEKLALLNVGPWIKSIPVVRYAFVQSSGLFETARVSVEVENEEGVVVFRGAGMGDCRSARLPSVMYEDGLVENDVDVSRIHVPSYMPLGRSFHAADRAQQSLVCALSTMMNPALFLSDDIVVGLGSELKALYLLVDGSAIQRAQARVMRRPAEKELTGVNHDVVGQDITMRLCTDRQIARHYEVIARATSHCLVVTCDDFVDVMSRGAYQVLRSPMKRYAAWLMLRDHCLYNPRLVESHVDLFEGIKAKMFARRLHSALSAKMAKKLGGKVTPAGGVVLAATPEEGGAPGGGDHEEACRAEAIAATRSAVTYAEKIKTRGTAHVGRDAPCRHTVREALGAHGLRDHARTVLPAAAAAGANAVVAASASDDDQDAPPGTAAAAADALRSAVDAATAAAQDALTRGRENEDLRFSLRVAVAALAALHNELGPEAAGPVVLAPEKALRPRGALEPIVVDLNK